MNSDKDILSTLFFGKYRTLKRIGCGSFGNVYKGINIIDKKNVAIKVEKKENGYNLLQKESYYLYNLRGIGIPELISYGYSGKYNVLVQTLLGESLGKIFFNNNNYFSLKDICMFTIQILHRIEYVHSKYLIHRDIKPENFLIGDPDKYMIYIIDFGLSKKYKSSRTNKHIQFQLTKKFTGTARYASINAVRGAEQSRRDDLEAIGYMLMYFFSRGKLPWQGVSCKEKTQKYSKIYNMKKNLNYEVFCKDMPKELISYMHYCRELQFEKEPNYEYLRNLFKNVLERNGFQNDLKFSWIKDYSILKNVEEIKNKINPINLSKKKQSPISRIYKKLESARETSKENNINENMLNKLINNNSQVNLQNNPILKSNTYTFQNNLGHKRFNSSWDIQKIKGKDSEMMKSSIAKYNSSIDDEEPLNNMSNINSNYYSNNTTNNNTLIIKNIFEKNNWNISNNGQLLNKNNIKNNLFYFSNNCNDMTKSLVLNKNNKESNQNTNKTISNPIKAKNENVIKGNNSNYSPNLVKSFSYVKKYNNKIDEIKINFNNSKEITKHTRNINPNIINSTNPLKENEHVLITDKNNSNIIYKKKKGSKTKINDMKKLIIHKRINSNNGTMKISSKNNLNVKINPILVNKNKNLLNNKIKMKTTGNNTTKNKKGKILKIKPKNIKNIPISPNNMHTNSYTNIYKNSSLINNTQQSNEYHLNQNKVINTNLKKEHLKIVNISNLSPDFSNNVEGKINKIKNLHIHSNNKKENNTNNKKVNINVIFHTNTNDLINLNQKRINKYKNMRHKANTKSGNLTIQNNNINEVINKSRPNHKTMNSTINNSNNTITNTIHSNNNNNTIISIYNNYNINKNSTGNGLYKDINGINIDFDDLNNNNNKGNNMAKYLSYNGYKLNNYKNYLHLNQRKSPTIMTKQKKINMDNYPSITPIMNHINNNNLSHGQTMGRNYSYQEKAQNGNLKNYFSLNGTNIPINEHKISKLMNISSVRHNLNSLKIKKYLTEMKYNDSNGRLFEEKKEDKILINNNNYHFINNNNRSNSFIFGKRTNYRNIISKYKNNNLDFEYYYPTINRKKTDIFYQKLPKFKMNFDIEDSNLIGDSRNNTPSFRRHDQSRDINKYSNENEFLSLKY